MKRHTALSVKRNQLLLKERQKTVLTSGQRVSLQDEKRLLAEKRDKESCFVGIMPLQCKLGRYYFLDLGDDMVARYLFWFGAFGYERSSAALFTSLAKKASWVIDLGAYSGYYSILATCLAGNANVIAIEANPYNYHRLSENLAINGSKAISRNLAIIPDGETRGSVKMMYNADLDVLDTGAFASHESAELIPQKKTKTSWFTVPALSFSSLAKELNVGSKEQGSDDDFILIKLDIEGLEAAVFSDILNCLSGSEIVVMVEILTQATAEKIMNIMNVHRGLAMAYVDEYSQTIALVEGSSLARREGSRNAFLCSSSRATRLVNTGVHNLLELFE